MRANSVSGTFCSSVTTQVLFELVVVICHMVGVPSMSRLQSVQAHEQDVAEPQQRSHLGRHIDGCMSREKTRQVCRPLGSLIRPVYMDIRPRDPRAPMMRDVTRYSQCHRLKN